MAGAWQANDNRVIASGPVGCQRADRGERV